VRRLTPLRLAATLAALAALLALTLALGIAVGPSGLAPGEVWDALAGRTAGAAADIVLAVRLPRVGLAAAVGAALAVAGVVFQALLRNPLADPYVLGVSGGAALGGIAVLTLGSTVGLGYAAVPPAAFAGALGALVLLLAVAGPAGRLSPTSLLLIGVVFNAFASAAIVFLASLAGLAEGAQVFLWLIGSLADARPALVVSVSLCVVAGLLAVVPFGRALDLLALGEESASLLGGRELPVGALTALAGGPFFLLLLRRTQARGLRG